MWLSACCPLVNTSSCRIVITLFTIKYEGEIDWTMMSFHCPLVLIAALAYLTDVLPSLSSEV